jgi:hypothetical protein
MCYDGEEGGLRRKARWVCSLSYAESGSARFFPKMRWILTYTAFLRWFLPHIQLLHVSPPHLRHIASKVRIVASMTELSFFYMHDFVN